MLSGSECGAGKNKFIYIYVDPFQAKARRWIDCAGYARLLRYLPTSILSVLGAVISKGYMQSGR